MHFERAGRTQREFDLTPLIDVVFNLLLFFILTASFVRLESMEVGLPSDEASTSPSAHSLLVDIGSEGRIWLNRAVVPPALVREKLQQAVTQHKDISITVRSGANVPVQKLVTLLDMVYQSGGSKVVVENWDEADKPATPTLIEPTLPENAPFEILEEGIGQ